MRQIPVPDFNRVLTAVGHREPDRVPLIDASISLEIMGRFLGKPVAPDDLQAQVEFWTQAGYDYIPLAAGMMQPGKVTMDSFISRVIQQSLAESGAPGPAGEDWNLETRHFIANASDFAAFPWEQAADHDLSKFRAVQQFLPPGMKIVALSGKIFTLSWMLMGYEDFCINLKLDPELVEQVVAKVEQIQYDALCKVIEMPNVAAFWAVDDLAFGTGTIISPADTRRLILPRYRRFAELCHAHGKPFFFHSDGVLWDILDDLIDLGVDALHPIDPTCMDIDEVKRRYGDRLCLFGNIPNDLLMAGTPAEVAALTRQRIRTLAPGGGYCVASGNSIPEWTALDNYRAMIETTLDYGVYPIKAEPDTGEGELK